MQNQFEQLLASLGEILNTPLAPDANFSCLIRFNNNQVGVQLEEVDNSGEIIVASTLGKLSPDAFRDRVFKAALSVNASPQSNIKGVLGFGEVSEQMYLTDQLNMSYLSGEKLAHYLQLFSAHAAIWIQALSSGSLPDLHALGMYHL